MRAFSTHEQDSLGEQIGEVVGEWRELMERNVRLFEEVRECSLLHGDFHLENLLQENGGLTGIIDAERAHFGDPAFDFATDYHRRKYSAGSAERIYRAYERHRALDADARLRRAGCGHSATRSRCSRR